MVLLHVPLVYISRVRSSLSSPALYRVVDNVQKMLEISGVEHSLIAFAELLSTCTKWLSMGATTILCNLKSDPAETSASADNYAIYDRARARTP